MNCKICGKEFIKNCNHQVCCSKECSEINHKKLSKEHQKSSKGKSCQKRYHQTDDFKISLKKYRQSDKYKKFLKKCKAKYKDFGFDTLNEYFEGSEGHHIDKINVIYIPKELHKSIWHSVTKNINLEPINTISFFFLMMQNINKLKLIYK